LGHNSLEACPANDELRQELLRKVAVVKLNGGLGTSMGLKGSKSALRVRGGLTFLDMTVRQIEYLNVKHGVDVPLILMNSFNTHDETLRIVRKYAAHNVSITCFQQSCFPCIERDHYTLLATETFSSSNRDVWYPPGHGDIYRALARSGVLDTLLAEGREYVFISNVDNLGGTLDFRIMYHLVNSEADFAMEVTRKTRSDVQGGTLIQHYKPEGGSTLKVLEGTEVPASAVEDFKSTKKFQWFNTNNLWVSLSTMKQLVEENGIAPSVIVTSRSVRERDVVQLETTAGSAIEFFPKAVAIAVDRLRFVPVKSTSDLLAIQSNVYEIKHGSVQRNLGREGTATPVVKLGPEFTAIAEYHARLPNIPDMLELDHLTVSGDVHFGKGVTLRGTVIIVAQEGSRVDVPDGSVLEDKVVTGNLRILEH
jgi:UTP--glucose-1-phosphate uridylyltransferase